MTETASAASAVSYERIRVASVGPSRTLTLHYPERRNAIGPQMIGELLHALDAAEGDASVRVVVLTGEGKAFCVGGDFGQMTGGAGAAATSVKSGERWIMMAREAET